MKKQNEISLFILAPHSFDETDLFLQSYGIHIRMMVMVIHSHRYKSYANTKFKIAYMQIQVWNTSTFFSS